MWTRFRLRASYPYVLAEWLADPIIGPFDVGEKSQLETGFARATRQL